MVYIIVQMQDGEQRYSNAYSLMSSPLDTTSWQIAVRLESPSKGGSRFMHQRVRAKLIPAIPEPITRKSNFLTIILFISHRKATK